MEPIQRSNPPASLFRIRLSTLLACLTNVAVICALSLYFGDLYQFDWPDIVLGFPVVAVYGGAALFFARSAHTLPASIAATVVGFFAVGFVTRVPTLDILMSEFDAMVLAVPFYAIVGGVPIVFTTYIICVHVSKKIRGY